MPITQSSTNVRYDTKMCYLKKQGIDYSFLPNIFPSPISPVLASSMIVSITASTWSLDTTISIFTFDTNLSLENSDPAYCFGDPPWAPKPLTSKTVKPRIPIFNRPEVTWEMRHGLKIASRLHFISYKTSLVLKI